MIRVALLGKIGSGKSFVSKLFKFPVFNADNEVKKIYKNDRECFRKFKRKLPNFISTFPIKKKEVIKAINSNKNNLKKISSIIHPIVRKKMENFLNKNKKSKIVVLDIPLLIENKLNKKRDVLIFVSSSNKNILKRLKKRPLFNKEILKTFKKNQSLLVKKRKLADYIVDNNYPPSVMENKIKLIKKKILNERNST
tara:strand:- start:178 stop:765 length:588 start_codon:yes stop_codon:yes gene_type:complete